MNLVNVGYDSANYYVLEQGNTRLLVDVGQPGTLPKLLATLKRKGIRLEAIDYLLVTHYHPDHGGIAQEVKNAGPRLIVLESQTRALADQKRYMKPDSGYVDIRRDDNVQLTFAESRAFLARLGFGGEIVPTPGHSDDSITLALDNGAAFTGDLHPPTVAGEEMLETVTQSWQRLQALKVSTLYPGHGPARPMLPISDQS
jgi:endoribonuclease LACTB2